MILKRIKSHILISAYIYLVLYIGYCFITWQLYNPLNLLTSLPYDSASTRGVKLASALGISSYSFILNLEWND